MKERTRRNTKLLVPLFVVIECCLLWTSLSFPVPAPGNLVVTESRVLPYTLDLRWDPPVNYKHEIVGYKIYYLVSTSESSSDWKVHIISGNDTFTSIPAPELVSPDSKYLLRLQAVGRNGTGLVSEEFTYVRDICRMPRDHGPCRESLQRYHYSPSHQSCVSFIYGGCGGNVNNFETREECETKCVGGNPYYSTEDPYI
ncbi:kunitz-type protease inhibitor 1-like, partial [Limulus polyphemus]|uniref:Kunitz-type protease inhibitor 1-like n=1 Tax=Limulus polyphemus TaxID=6850 RepID=A0ABM1TFJ3_LIMPO